MAEIAPPAAQNRRSSITIWLLIAAAIALLERLAVILFYQPVSFSDTPSYRRLAETVLAGFANYDGTRTPGYPVFLALTGSDTGAWVVQLLLGFLTTLLLFYIGWKLTHIAWFAGVIALAHSLNLGQLFFESNLLTESLTTFLLVLTMSGVLLWLIYPRLRGIWLAFFIGLSATITLLVRPLFIYLPFFLLGFLWLIPRLEGTKANGADGDGEHTGKKRVRLQTWRCSIALIVPVGLLLGGWVTFIHQQYNQWSLTTMTGYHLIQHTGSYFEYVPDEYAALRDTYIKYRDQHIAQYGTQTNAIWDAIPEMSKVSGYSFFALSRVLTRISIQLIWQHPLLFLKNALSGWWMFWRAPVYWSPAAVKLQGISQGINVLILLERGVLILTNIFFILSSSYLALSEIIPTLRRKASVLIAPFREPAQSSFMWMMLANIWIASILQTLLDHGDNPRFLVPMQSLVVLWVAVYLYQVAVARRRHEIAIPSSSSKPPDQKI